MIEFIQDYTTKALPPESFEDGQRVERSKESELYLVRLGVAAFVRGEDLLDQDFQPLNPRKPVAVVVGADRRFAAGGRGGEMLGLDAPQRATTGPGNLALFAAVDSGPSRVEIEQLRADAAASAQQLDEHRELTTAQIAELTGNLTTAQGAREAALADLAAANTDKATLTTERDAARADAAASATRIAELETSLAAATASSGGDDAAKTKTK